MRRFIVEYIQAVEPEELSKQDGITVRVDDELDSMGFNRVDVEGPSPADVIEYVRENWGDEDPDFFAEYIVGRIREIPQPITTRPLIRGGQVEAFDADSDEFAEIVDSEWYGLTKGELWITPNYGDMDTATRDLVERMASAAVENIASFATAQTDGDGNDIEVVTEREIARRVAAALSVLFYGGA